jgi:Protein of unknown function (DUF2809)
MTRWSSRPAQVDYPPAPTRTPITRPIAGARDVDRRRRLAFVALAVATIALGLLVHLRGAALGPVARDVLGDALWAAMIAWWAGALAPNARLATRTVAAYAVCAAVETSQRYHAPALDAVRATLVGHLILGSGFDARDLAAYALGVAGAALIEIAAVARRGRPTAAA